MAKNQKKMRQKVEKKEEKPEKKKSSRADRHNNPTAFIYSKYWAKKLKDLGIDTARGDSFKGENGNTYYTMKFNDSKDGLKAALHLWDSMEKKYGSIEKVLENWSKGAAEKARINGNKKWSELTGEEKKKLLKSQMKIEGFTKPMNDKTIKKCIKDKERKTSYPTPKPVPGPTPTPSPTPTPPPGSGSGG